MAKTGFVIKVKSKGKEYFYLRKSERNKEDKSKKRDTNIYSFGTREKAVENLTAWKNNTSDIPDELKKMNYGKEDILSWIEKIENK